MTGRTRQRYIRFKMRLQHGKALHSQLALRLGERDDGRRLAVACHAGLSACLRRRSTGGGAQTVVIAPSPLQAWNLPVRPKKELQNYGAEGMLPNNRIFGVFAP